MEVNETERGFVKTSIFIVVLALFLYPFFSYAGTFSAAKPAAEDVLKAIIYAAEKTAVRSALLYGLLGQETGYGSYLGKTESEWASFCAIRNTSDCFNWRTYDCKADYLNARYFNEILDRLGYARKDVPVSSTCAMGFTQFEPNTLWQLVKGKGIELLNPWNISDAFMASGYYLKDLGADSGEVLSSGEVIGEKDKIALQRYYCGGNYARRECVLYAQSVEDKARRAPALLLVSDFETQLRLLEEEENRLRAQFGQEPKKLTPKTSINIPLSLPPPQIPTAEGSIIEKPSLPAKQKVFGTFGNINYLAASQEFLYLAGEDAEANWRIEKRHKQNGAYDESFGTGGALIVKTDGIVTIPILAADSKHLYIFGNDREFSGRIEKRFISDGSLDQSFGDAGSIKTRRLPRGIIIDSGFIYIMEYASPRTYIEKRYVSNGTMDSNFGDSGVIESKSEFFDIASDGISLYLAGAEGDNFNFLIEKRSLLDGKSDPQFGVEGRISILVQCADYPSGARGCVSSSAQAIALDNDYIYAVGAVPTMAPIPGQITRVEKRFKSNGGLDNNFGVGGFFEIPGLVGYDFLRGLELRAGYLYVSREAHDEASGVPRYTIGKYLLSDGATSDKFGVGGKITVPYRYSRPRSWGSNLVNNAVVSDDNYLYFGYYAPSGWIIERRFLSTGAVDTNFRSE